VEQLLLIGTSDFDQPLKNTKTWLA